MRRTAFEVPSQIELIFHSMVRFFAGASRLVLQGLGVAVLMGVIFGLVIGVGGSLLGVEMEHLYVAGGLSGWVSSFIAMMFIFQQLRRKRNLGH